MEIEAKLDLKKLQARFNKMKKEILKEKINKKKN